MFFLLLLCRASRRPLQETGFGNVFPNYIVDVQKDAATGEYTEAIQFQCLGRGNVRIFEGINYLTRSRDMSPERLAAMHARAAKARARCRSDARLGARRHSSSVGSVARGGWRAGGPSRDTRRAGSRTV